MHHAVDSKTVQGGTQHPLGDTEHLTEVMNIRGVVVNASEAEEDRPGQYLGGTGVCIGSEDESFVAPSRQPPTVDSQD